MWTLKKSRAYHKEYRRRNRDKISAWRKKWRKKNWKRVYKEGRADFILRAKKSYLRRKDEVLRRTALWSKRRRLEIKLQFGGVCQRCGCEDIQILQFHRKDLRTPSNGQGQAWAALKSPKLYRLLCPNCNSKIRVRQSIKKNVTTSAIKLRKMRDKAISILGGKCVRCGFSDKHSFELDHVAPRFATKLKKTRTCIQALKNPTAFQILCSNCHRWKSLQEAPYIAPEKAVILENVELVPV